MKKIAIKIIGISLTILILISINLESHVKKARVVFLSDTHATVDAKDRDLNWSKNSFDRIKAIFATENLKPSHVIWLGDIIDFMPEEWEIAKKWINWISKNSESKQYALMGNHDYFYYNYPEIAGTFNSFKKNNNNYLPYEIDGSLIKEIHKGDTIINVLDANKFLVDKEILLIETPDYNTINKYQINTIKKINKNSIELNNPVLEDFKIKNTSVRQGYTEKRGIEYFLEAFKNTETKATKKVFFIGNNCFILMSMDNYYNRDLNAKTRAIPETDFKWFESQLIKYQNTHNIIVVMHELPESGKVLGGIYDPNDVIEYDNYTREKFIGFIDKYNIVAWVSGHNHPDIRKNTINYKYNKTTFLVSPSLGTNIEGQVLKLDIVNGKNSLDFEYWSTDKNELIKKIEISVNKININN